MGTERGTSHLAVLPSAGLAAEQRPGLPALAASRSVTEGARDALGDRGLENIANNCARAGQRHDHPTEADHRESRWAALGFLWRESTLKRPRACRRWPITNDGRVQVRVRGGAAGYAGLSTCGSVHVCPPCNSRIMAGRRLELGAGLAATFEEGAAAFGAMTLHHHAASDLDSTWRALNECWHAVAVDKKVREARADLHLRGIIRRIEVTWSAANGWHPHLHPLLSFSERVDSKEVGDLHREHVRAWMSAAERRGLVPPSTAAQRLRLVIPEFAEEALADYLAKGRYVSGSGLGWEMTSTQTKKTRSAKGLTPWDLLDGARLHGDADALRLWHVWEQGSRGKKSMTWSRGLKRQLLDAEDVSDEELARAVVGDDDDTVLTLLDWSWVRAAPRDGAVLINQWHRGGWTSVKKFCDDRGIPYREGT